MKNVKEISKPNMKKIGDNITIDLENEIIYNKSFFFSLEELYAL